MVSKKASFGLRRFEKRATRLRQGSRAIATSGLSETNSPDDRLCYSGIIELEVAQHSALVYHNLFDRPLFLKWQAGRLLLLFEQWLL